MLTCDKKILAAMKKEARKVFKKPMTEYLWAVYSPEVGLIYPTVRMKRQESIGKLELTSGCSWGEAVKRWGVRCLPIKVSVVPS